MASHLKRGDAFEKVHRTGYIEVLCGMCVFLSELKLEHRCSDIVFGVLCMVMCLS